MRRIDSSLLQLSQIHSDALARAAAGTTTAGDRKKYIDEHAHCWRALRGTLETASMNKCWYCETDRKRTDFAVDHFRPKNRVAECTSHNGYWWLAFELGNFRLSCTYCNERRVNFETDGGKADHFPLVDESARCMTPNGDLELEEPELLDPLAEFDAGLLRFDSDGDVNPRFGTDLDDIGHQRAAKSIALYHLKDPVLRRARADTIRKVYAHLTAAQYFRTSGGSHLRDYKRLLREMRSAISEAGEYSAAVEDVLGPALKLFLNEVEAA